MTMDELFRSYSRLERFLSREFVFQPGQTKQDFEQALLSLRHSGALVIAHELRNISDIAESKATPSASIVQVKKSLNKHTTFYSQMFEPFLLAYWVVCQHLLSLPVDIHGRPLPRRPKDLTKDVQRLSVRLLEESAVKHFEILSLDLINNGILMLMDVGAMYQDKRNNETWLSPNSVAMAAVADEIGGYIELPSIPIGNFTSNVRPIVMQAKL